ncbi:MAG: DEAD/DEAH box helicase [Marinilabiliaceae bacterium]
MKDIVLAIVKHRVVGNIFVAYTVHRVSDCLLQVDGHVSQTTLMGDDVSPDVAKIIRLLDEISEPHLQKVFARGKSGKAFWDSVTDDVLKQSIRPYVDRRICEVLQLAANAGLDVYRRSERYQTINTKDRLSIAPPFKSRPRFFFNLTPDGSLLYTLKISDGVTDVPLYQSGLEELSLSPAIFVAGGVIFSARDIPFSKFRPFGTKPRIVVETKFVDMYMNKVVMPSLAAYKVSAYGFTVNKSKGKPQAELRSVDTIFGVCLKLVFIYTWPDGSCVECDSADRLKPVKMGKDVAGAYTFDVIQRDFRLESELRQSLICDMGLSEQEGLLTLEHKADEIDLARWAYGVCDMLDERGIKVVIADSGLRYYSGGWNVNSEVSAESDWFDLRIIVHIGEYDIPFRRFFRFISRAERLFPLPDGSVFVIPDEWFQQWSGVIPLIGGDDEDAESPLKISRDCASLLSDFIPATTDLNLPDEAAMASARAGNISTYVAASLRPYQEVGVRWMLALARNGRGGILADDMGLGKTLQVITLLANIYALPYDGAVAPFRRNDTGRNPTLIVMPVSLIFNWMSETGRFAPQLSTYVYVGKNALAGRTLPLVLGQYHIVLTSYGVMRSCIDSLSNVDFEGVILDESHWAKNPASKTYTALRRLKSKFWFNLSGTPVENSLTDLWAQINLVRPGLLGSRASFEQSFRRQIERKGDEGLMARLRAITSPYILRRSKEQVLSELPELLEQTIACSMTDEQAEVYEREKSACRNALLGNEGDAAQRRFVMLQALTRLRLIANNPALCSDDYDGGSGKTEAVLDTISNISRSGHKMLVFSSFVMDLELLGSRLDAMGIKYLMLVGSTKNREAVVEQFRSDPGVSVLLMSLKVGGVGLNLTCADYVLMLNPWWNPAAERQAYGRAHRMGQKSCVTVLRFITQGSIEQKIDDMQARKLQLAANAVHEAERDSLPTDAELVELLSA